MKNLIFLIATFLMLTSCRTTKTEYVRQIHTIRDTIELVKIDTVKIEKLTRVTPPTTTTVVLDDPCGEDGKLREASISSGGEAGNIKVKIDSNKIVIQGYSAEQVQEKIKEEVNTYRERNRTLVENYNEVREELKTRSVWSKWTYGFLIWAILVTVVLFSRLRAFIPKLL